MSIFIFICFPIDEKERVKCLSQGCLHLTPSPTLGPSEEGTGEPETQEMLQESQHLNQATLFFSMPHMTRLFEHFLFIISQ